MHFPLNSDTWIENWPKLISELSFVQYGVPLSIPQIHAMGWCNGIHRHLFESKHAESLIDLQLSFDEILTKPSSGFFVRLGSRSPKDTALGVLTKGRVFQGNEALKLLTSGSRRVAFDFLASLRCSYQPWVFFRAWQEINWYEEFRCFLYEKQLIGISQYHYDATLPLKDTFLIRECVFDAVADFLPRFLSAWNKPNVTFDIWISNLTKNNSVTLIELNPWNSPTDPCLFSWEKQDFDRSLRIRTEMGIEKYLFPKLLFE